MNFTIKTEEDLPEVANFIIQNLSLNQGNLIALNGQMGAGKTTLTKVLCKMLGVSSNVNSPTFIIQSEHKHTNGNLFHLDLYRLETSKELDELNLKSLAKNQNEIIIIEWANKFEKEILELKDYFKIITVNIDYFVEANERVISVEVL